MRDCLLLGLDSAWYSPKQSYKLSTYSLVLCGDNVKKIRGFKEACIFLEFISEGLDTFSCSLFDPYLLRTHHTFLRRDILFYVPSKDQPGVSLSELAP